MKNKFFKTLASIITLAALLFPVVSTAQPTTILSPRQGGTGIGTATVGNIGNCVKVITATPFAYTLGTCGSGSGGGTFASTTSQVAGQTLNYSNASNPATDIVLVGGAATSSAVFILNPNTGTSTLNHTLQKSLNNYTVYADQYPGANAGEKIAAATLAIPASGGTVDARGLKGVPGTFDINTAAYSFGRIDGRPITYIFSSGTTTVDTFTTNLTVYDNVTFVGNNTVIAARPTTGITGSGNFFDLYSTSVTGTIAAGSNILTVSDASYFKVGKVVGVAGMGGASANQFTTISASINAATTSIPFTSTSGLGSGSTSFIVGTEIITGTISGNYLINATRGALGSAAASHTNGDTISYLSSDVTRVNAINGNAITLQDVATQGVTNTAVGIGSTNITFTGDLTIDGTHYRTLPVAGSLPRGIAGNYPTYLHVAPTVTLQNFDFGGLGFTAGWYNDVSGVFISNGRPDEQSGAALNVFGEASYNMIRPVSMYDSGRWAIAIDDRTTTAGIYDGQPAYNIIDVGPITASTSIAKGDGIALTGNNNTVKYASIYVPQGFGIYLLGGQWTVDPLVSNNTFTGGPITAASPVIDNIRSVNNTIMGGTITGTNSISGNTKIQSVFNYIEGNIGIGTSTPNNPFVVVDPASGRSFNAGMNNGGVYLKDDNGSGSTMGYYFYGSAGADLGGFGASISNNSLNSYIIGTPTNNRITILNNGNVGIGNVTPGSKLNVQGETSGQYFTATSTTNASTFPYASTTAISFTTACFTGDICRTTWPTGGGGGGGSSHWATSTDGTSIYNTNLGGNVGIGTTTPIKNLTVYAPQARMNVQSSNTSDGNFTDFTITNSGGMDQLSLGYGHTGRSDLLQGRAYLTGAGLNDIVFGASSGKNLIFATDGLTDSDIKMRVNAKGISDASGRSVSNGPTITVSTTTATGDTTSIASALALLPSTGGSIELTCGTFTLSSGLKIDRDNVTIKGQGGCTVIAFNAATVPVAITNSDFSDQKLYTILTDFTIDQTGTMGTGTCFDFSNFAFLRTSRVNCTDSNIGFMASTSGSYYNTFDSPVLLVGGTSPRAFSVENSANFNTLINPRISTSASGTGIYINAHSTQCISCEVETGSLYGIDVGSAGHDSKLDVYLELNQTNLRLASGVESVRVTGYISSGTTANITDNGARGFSFDGWLEFEPYRFYTGNATSVGSTTRSWDYSVSSSTPTSALNSTFNGSGNVGDVVASMPFISQDTSGSLTGQTRGSIDWVAANTFNSSFDLSFKYLVAGIQTSNFNFAQNGNMGISSTSPYARLDVVGRNNETEAPLFQLSSMSSLVPTTRLFVNPTGRLVMGTSTTANPTGLLFINDVSSGRTFSAGMLNGTVRLKDENGGGAAFGYGWTGSGGTDRGEFGAFLSNDTLSRFYVGTPTTGEIMIWNPTTGNVGIGTTTPGGRLGIQGNMFIAGNIVSTSTTASSFPYASTTALTVSGAIYNTSLADGCLNVTSGLVGSTGSACGSGGGGTNYLTNSGANTYLNLGSNLQAPSLNATSTTATSTFEGGMSVFNGEFVVDQFTGTTTIQNLQTGNILLDTNFGNVYAISGNVTPAASGLTQRMMFDNAASSTALLNLACDVNAVGNCVNNRIGVASTTPWKTLSIEGGVAMNGLTTAAGTVGSVCLNANTKELMVNGTSIDCSVSAAKYKQNISTLDIGGLNSLMKFKPATFEYKSNPGVSNIGFIADDLEKIDKRLVSYDDKGELQGLNTVAILSVTARAVQQQAVLTIFGFVLLGGVVVWQQYQIRKLKK